MTESSKLVEALTDAVKHHEAISENIPGRWTVDTSEGSVFLVWSCEENDEEIADMCGDEPWSEFGGSLIIADAGVRDCDDSGCDSYQDQYGDDVVSQWVEWRL